MKIFDFNRRKPPVPPPTPPEPPVDLQKSQSPEEILGGNWAFKPDYVKDDGTPIYNQVTVQVITSLATARALMDIAEDVAAIRKHMTRLQLVAENTEPAE